MPKVGKGPATLQSRPFRTGGKRAELDLVVADAEMGCGRPGERAITRDLSFCAADRNISRVPAMEKGIVETGLYVIRYELDRLVQSVLEVFDNVGCDKVADAALGYQIMVIPKVEEDDERLDAGEAIDICHDNRDYAALWSEFLIGKHEAAHPHTRGNES